jgi:hypothetical protein
MLIYWAQYAFKYLTSWVLLNPKQLEGLHIPDLTYKFYDCDITFIFEFKGKLTPFDVWSVDINIKCMNSTHETKKI